MEDLARRLVETINGAAADQRQDLRDYAIDLVREGTEAIEAPREQPARKRASGTNPLGMGLLLFLVALPMCLLFPPVGLALLAVAILLGGWGIVVTLVRR